MDNAGSPRNGAPCSFFVTLGGQYRTPNPTYDDMFRDGNVNFGNSHIGRIRRTAKRFPYWAPQEDRKTVPLRGAKFPYWLAPDVLFLIFYPGSVLTGFPYYPFFATLCSKRYPDGHPRVRSRSTDTGGGGGEAGIPGWS